MVKRQRAQQGPTQGNRMAAACAALRPCSPSNGAWQLTQRALLGGDGAHVLPADIPVAEERVAAGHFHRRGGWGAAPCPVAQHAAVTCSTPQHQSGLQSYRIMAACAPCPHIPAAALPHPSTRCPWRSGPERNSHSLLRSQSQMYAHRRLVPARASWCPGRFRIPRPSTMRSRLGQGRRCACRQRRWRQRRGRPRREPATAPCRLRRSQAARRYPTACDKSRPAV